MKKALKIIVDILAWVVLVFAFIITLLIFTTERNNGVPTLLGRMPMSVASDSMSPTFNKGDLIIDEKIDDLFKLKVDDVITFYTYIDGQRVLNTHRIVEINEGDNTRSFITRGDNNEADDKIPVGAGDVVGKWTGAKFAKAGKALDFIRTKEGFFICILIPVALFFLFELYKFISVLIEVKSEKMSEEDEEAIKKKAIEEYLAQQKADAQEADVKETADAVEVAEMADATQADDTVSAEEATEPEETTSEEKMVE